jgi:peptidyl-prolyl cis-trans isomerase-like 1
MPLTASDSGGGPLKFSVSIKPKVLAATIAPASNRSLVLNVSGVDSNNAPFAGDLVLQLYEDLTPRTTARIIDLVNSNFYNDLTFHRVITNFACQGGDPNGNGTGGSGIKFDDEFVAALTYTGFGQLAMANAGHDSNDSQFFITDGDLSVGDPQKQSPWWLDFENPIFGQMTRGFDVLEKLMGTPVNPTNNAPLTKFLIDSATIITNSQDAVLRLAAPAGFTGTVAVTVSAMNASKQTAEQTLTVNVVANTVNDPPFLGFIPASLTITQGQVASFLLTTMDLENDQLTLDLQDTDTGAFPTNLTVSIGAGRLWFVPNQTTTGTVHLILGLTDLQLNHQDDTQRFSIIIDPRSATPTLNIVPKSGSITVVPNSQANRVNIAGTFAFTGQSDHTFTNGDIVVLTLGDQNNPLILTNLPTDAGYSVKKGVVTLKSPKSTNTTVSAQFNSGKGTFKISVSNFHFPGPQSNPLQVGLSIGPDYGTDVRTWVEKKPGMFSPH